MAYINGNKPIVTNGLVYALDFGNPKSYTSGSNTARSMVFDPSGTTAVTSSAVVQYPTYTLTTPFFNNGILDFQGAEFIRRTGSFSILDPEKEFTIHIVSKVITAGNLFSINSTSGNLSTFVSQSNTTFGFNISAGDFSRTYPGLTTSSLQHVTYRYSSGSIDLFINGIPITASAVNQSLLTAVTTNALFINKDPNTSTFQTAFSGSVGQFYVYNRALTANEIYSNYLISAERYDFPTINKPYTQDENVYKYIQTSGITDQNTISAISTFVTGLKLNKLWDKIVGIYPFIGNTTGSQRINLKDPGVLNLTYSGSWSASNSGSFPISNTSYIQSPLGSGTTYPTINSQSFHTSVLSYDTPQTSSYIAGGVSGQGALGGTVTYANGKVIHTFTTEGSSSIVFTNPSITQVEVLVVGGGGGGGRHFTIGNRGGGGGGAGGLIFSSSFNVTPLSTLDVVVGAGGNGGTTGFPNCTGSNGQNSQFGTLVAFGGGGGGPAGVASGTGSNGGSGGGAGRPAPNSFASGGLGIPGQGNDGGIISDLNEGGGSGGGGAAGKGLYGGLTFSEGGPGLPISTSGMPVSYSAGGRSGYWFLDWSPTQINGLPNTGNGGWGNRGADAGKGGSGVVIVSYNLIPGGGPKTGIYLTETSVSGAINNETPAGITGSGTIGLLTISRTGSTSLIISKNNTTSSIASAASPKVSLNLPFGATNQADQISTITPYSIAYASIGAGLTTSEVSTYYNLVSQLQTNLKRQNTLLDTYTGSAAAYSLRRIGPSGYFGPAIRVRRDSDNTLRDIGFTSDGQLDTVGLLDFVGVTGSGFVNTWYDQSGNSRDASQVTTGSQPLVISSGVLLTLNSKPAIRFDGVNDNLNKGAFGFPTTNISIVKVNNRIGESSNGDSIGYSSSPLGGLININSSVISLDGRPSGGAYFVANSGLATTNNQILQLNVYDGSNMKSSANGNAFGTTAVSANPIIYANQTLIIGSVFPTSGYGNGNTQELVIWDVDQTTNRTAIESNINTNYKIYGSATASFDPDYSAFITATGITQPTQSAALETLVSDLKSYGLWSKIKAIYPMVTDKNNRFAYSQELDTGWNPVNTVVATNNVTAPDGTLTAERITETTSSITTYTVTNNGASAYTINGSDNPVLTLERGKTYQFNINASGHPFYIMTGSGAYTAGGQYDTGVTGQGTQVGTLTFVVPDAAPSTLAYVCQFHSSMGNTINVINNTDQHHIYQTIATGLVTGSEYVASIYGKFLNRPWLAMETNTGAKAWFNIQTGITGSLTGSNATITSVGSGWYRCALYFTSSVASGPQNIQYNLADANGNLSYAGVLGTGSYLWGAQFENGNVLGPYRATTSTGFTTGSMLDQMKFNLKSTSSFSGSFVGNWNPGYGGNKPDGVTGYMNTNYNPSSSGLLNSAHLSHYGTTNLGIGTIFALLGVKDGSTKQDISPSVLGGDSYNSINSTDVPIGTIYTRVDSFILSNRNSPIEFNNWYKNNKVSTVVRDSTSIPNGNIFISGRNNNGSLLFPDLNTKAFVTIGDGLTDYEAKALYWIVQKYQTTLGRQVY